MAFSAAMNASGETGTGVGLVVVVVSGLGSGFVGSGVVVGVVVGFGVVAHEATRRTEARATTKKAMGRRTLRFDNREPPVWTDSPNVPEVPEKI
jgi:hypothetical protein